MEKLLFTFLYRNGIYNLNEKDVKLQLLSHNEYPSLQAVTDTLDYFGINNIAANVPTDALGQLPKYFLALVNLNLGTELVLVTQHKSSVSIKSINTKKIKMTLEEFGEQWTGTLIAIEVDEEKKSKIPFQISFYTAIVPVLFSIMLLAAYFKGSNILEISYLTLSFLGIMISYLVVKETLGIKDTLTAKICGSFSKSNNNCSTVINSKEGKLLGSITLGDLSIGYFSVIFLSALLIPKAFSILFLLSIVSLPFVGYTIMIQAFKLKTFCLLCLSLSMVLISQFVVLFFQFSNWDFSFSSVLTFLFISVSILGIGGVLQKFWKDSIQLEQTEHSYLKFKRNESFFQAAFQAMPYYSLDTFGETNTISFGNKNAKIKIQAITNPFCGFCKNPFETYTSLLQKYPNDIELQFIFNVSNDPESEAASLSIRILELYDINPKEALKALQDWFEERDYDRWKKQYLATKNLHLQSQHILKHHYEWCQKNGIKHTPETLLNGRSFPKKEYELSDLKLFIETLKFPMVLATEKI